MLDLSSPTIYVPTIFVTLLAIFTAILYKDSRRVTHEHTRDLPYYYEISLSFEYLHRNLNENGRFNYRKNVDPEIKYPNTTYNSLRHAGVLYALNQFEEYGLEKKYHEERVNSANYFIARYIKKLDDNKFFVVSLPDEEGIKFPIAKSGAAGVALAALSNLVKTNEIELGILQKLGEFLLFMQNEEGKVYAYYDVEKKLINKEAEAIFYPGEVAYGLLCLFEVDSQQKWLDSAKKILLYIANERKNDNLDLPFDHWALLATEKLLGKNVLSVGEIQILKQFCEYTAIPILSTQITNPKNTYYGAFQDNIRPASLGTIMEGLAAVYFCTNNTSLQKIILKSLSIGNSFLSKVQVKTGQQAGGLPNSANWVKPGVTPNASIIRIDNVQHVVSGWIRYQNILKITGQY